MKTFIINDKDGKTVGAALDISTAMDLVFDRALKAGRVDMDEGTFEAEGETITEMNSQEAIDGGLLTEQQIADLDQEGLVML
jgi:hypothetical protein